MIYPKALRAECWTDACASTFMAVWFATARRMAPPERPSRDDGQTDLKRKEIPTRAATWMNREDIVLSK